MARVNVKELRDRHGMSAQRLADHLGVHVRTIGRWENRESDPSPLALKQLRDLDRQRRAQARDGSDEDSAASSDSPPSGLLPSSRS